MRSTVYFKVEGRGVGLKLLDEASESEHMSLCPFIFDEFLSVSTKCIFDIRPETEATEHFLLLLYFWLDPWRAGYITIFQQHHSTCRITQNFFLEAPGDHLQKHTITAVI